MTRRPYLRILAVSLALAVGLPSVVALGGCAGADIPAPKGVPQKTAETAVYFSTGRSLIEEKRLVDATNKYADTLTKLLAADPKDHPGVAIVQPVAKVKSVTFKDGLITVDWSKDILKFDADPSEKVLAWAAFLETFGQFPEVKTVKFTVEGKDSGTIDGKSVQNFWGRISLKGQPWKALRPPDYASLNASSTVPTAGVNPTATTAPGQ